MTEPFAKRLDRQLKAQHLTFSCYRIRRRWSLPLPITSLSELDVQVRGFAHPYPWEIWCLWALEERLFAMSGAVTFLDDQGARDRCIEDLEALAQWPRYTVANKLDLPYGHAVQLMATALRDWTWLPEATQQALRRALQRAVEEGMPLVPPAVQALARAEELLAKPSPHQHLHNIPLIAQAALASAAEAIGHPERERLSSRFLQLFQARLALYHEGLTEGISYDGYLYNFALSWLSTQSSAVIESIVHHPAMQDLEDQARGLACPGQVAQSAEIGDVEPLEMPFVWSALARLQQWAFSDSRETLLDAVPAEWLRADALWVRAHLAGQQTSQESNTAQENPRDSLHGNALAVPVVQQSTAAVTLATGLGDDDLSVVMSLCRSPMNHIQADTGTLLVGHAGHWWITDPGYQQYLKTSERDFTLGPEAHNTPVVNGYGQAHKAGKLFYSGECQPTSEFDGAYAVVDLTACYPVEAQAETVTRTVWRLGRDQVVVCDTVVVAPDASVRYNWHGDAEAYWGEQGGAVSLYQDDSHKALWIQSGQQPLSLAQQHRLRGSRGQCTLQVEQPVGVVHHWWCFSFADVPPEFHAEGTQAVIGAHRLSLENLCSFGQHSAFLDVVIHRDQIQVSLVRGDEFLGCLNRAEWVLRLMVNGEVHQSFAIGGRSVYFTIPAIASNDEVLLTARPSGTLENAEGQITRLLTTRERQAIRSIPLRVIAQALGNEVCGRCELLPDAMEGEVEYAFYLMVDGMKSQVQWYQRSPEHCFTMSPEEAATGRVQIRGFARVVAAPDQKLSASSPPIDMTTPGGGYPGMTDQPSDNGLDAIKSELASLEKTLLQAGKDQSGKFTKDLIIVQNRLYAQLEALTWLSRAVGLSWSLPALRGWAASPDVLLRLHEHIRYTKPKVVVECGSGSSTLVIADALRQNGIGRLISLDHSPEFGGKTRQLLKREGLLEWVDLRIAELEPWNGLHLSDESEEVIKWYSQSSVNSVDDIDLLFVDGPPGATCKFARYPALPAFAENLSPDAQIWMDDTIRQEEVDICKDWAERFGYSTEFFPLEKGLGILAPMPSREHPVMELRTGLDASVLAAIEQHLAASRPKVILQFGVSEVTLPLVRALKAHGKGRLICVAAPHDVPEGLNQYLETESLHPNFSLLLSELTGLSYPYPADCDAELKQWFPESLLSSLPELDWLIVDGPDWKKNPCTRYPALPSVLHQLTVDAQIWMLGVQNPQVQAVVDMWCRDYDVFQGAIAMGGTIRLLKVARDVF